MFTGLVEATGVITALDQDGPTLRVTIKVPDSLPDADTTQIGDSISISGCCLTVIEVADGQWSFEAGAETCSKTSLGERTVGDRVNLERSLPVNGRMGGHFVQGHVDGTAAVIRIEHDGDWTNMFFDLAPSLAAQLVPKGSITVDGISLTIVHVGPASFSVALIPHTLEMTTLGERSVNDRVNIETDILGKYVMKFMTQTGNGPSSVT
jgi:riboflavin synthase